MKNIILLGLTFLSTFNCKAQDITGQWNGTLKEVQLRLVFDITKTENGFVSTMDSPDQGANGIPVSSTSFENLSLKLEIPKAQIEYNGTLKDSIIIGTFKQGGQVFTMNLSKGKQLNQTSRIQEPKIPYPYYTEEVTFTNNKANISLRGTLTLPKKEGKFPVVILISGSGPQNRDEELMGHKPFLVISDYFTKNGIAVLRYDDRGVGQSKGDFNSATTADFANDAESAIAYLKTRNEIDKKKIGLVGHSEGGIIASIVASRSKDLNFIVLLSSTGIPGYKVLLQQQELIAKASGISTNEIQKSKELNSKVFQLVLSAKDNETLKIDLEQYLRATLLSIPNNEKPKEMSDDEFISVQVNQLSNPWMQYFLKFDPATVLDKVDCAVLVVNGAKDLQVAPKENLSAIENALKKGGNKGTTIIFPNLNHLFQECNTGLPNEYGKIEQTFSPIALEEIKKWIIKQLK